MIENDVLVGVEEINEDIIMKLNMRKVLGVAKDNISTAWISDDENTIAYLRSRERKKISRGREMETKI